MESTLKDYLTLIIKESIKDSQHVLDFGQLSKARRFLTDQIESCQLKQAIMCFRAKEVPLTVFANRSKLKKIQDWFRRELFWKIQEEKDKLRDLQEQKFKSNHSKEQLL
jgi:hypothetical protein